LDHDRQWEELTQLVHSLLAPRFGEYEAAARLQPGSDEFRRGLAVALTEFLTAARPAKPARQLRTKIEPKKRLAARRTDAARLARSRANSPETRDAADDEYKRAFVEWLSLQQWQDEISARRRPKLKAMEALVRTVASVYSAATGRRPTIVTNKSDFTGPFADLLRAIDFDARRILDQISPEWKSLLAANIVAYARTLRLTAKHCFNF
jgi:hypothetical protein